MLDHATQSTKKETPDKKSYAHETRASESAGTVASITQYVKQLCSISGLNQSLRILELAPFGYYLEVPDNAPFTQNRLGRPLWHLLASLSGQFNRSFIPFLPDNSCWKKMLLLDPMGQASFESKYQLELNGVCSETGEVCMSLADLSEIMLDPLLGPILVHLLETIRAARKDEATPS